MSTAFPVAFLLLICGSAFEVMIPASTHDGDYVVVKTKLGASHRVQVPQGFSNASFQIVGQFAPLEVERTMIVPEAASSQTKSLQVHLHHGDRSTGSSLAVSWATPSTSLCLPEVILGTGTSCANLPPSMNGASHPKGCPGAVFSGGKPSSNYCSGASGTYPWWNLCCKWEDGSCQAKLGSNGTNVTGTNESNDTRKVTGVTRSYSEAVYADGSNVSFQHVALSQLTDGDIYNYTVSCNGTSFSASFTAPRQTILANDSYSFAVFGDMGISNAAHDTVDSMSAVLDQLHAVYHIGDLSYARGVDNVWNEWFAMIEPIASRIPWDVMPGNHDIRNGDSAGECGLPMLARFETPSSFAAWPALSASSKEKRCSNSFNFTDGNPYWWAVDVGHARIITYSTDSNLTTGSAQRKWLQAELESANTAEARAAHPWVLLMGHKPMYTASTYPGCMSTRGKGEAAGEGTEGALTAELEELFVANKVDVSFYGHIHSYNRMFPVKDNGATVERSLASESRVYRSPNAPVHMMVGMSGASHLHQIYDSPEWSAHAEITFGWLKATFANSSALHLEFVANGEGNDRASVHDDVWITKTTGPATPPAPTPTPAG